MTMDTNGMTPSGSSSGPGFPGIPPGLLPKRSFGLKLLLVCALALLMAIPAMFVFTVLYDRSDRAENAMSEVSQRYGGQQTSMGPVLVLPFTEVTDIKNGEPVVTRGKFILYPEDGSIRANLKTELKKSGIHQIPVYGAEIDYKARFDPSRIDAALPVNATPDWQNAKIYLSMSDSRAAREPTRLTVDGKPLVIEPVSTTRNDSNSRYGPVPVTQLAGILSDLELMEDPFQVEARMVFSGGRRIAFAPFARNTQIDVISDWNDPKLQGGFQQKTYTPDETGGFSASWSIPYEARGIPGMGFDLNLAEVTGTANTIAIEFVQNATPYQSVQRALKYALMFIGFVFLAYFLFEVTSHQRAHPAQYVLVGLSQSVFYLLLLAMAEQFGFDLAFLVAASMTVTLTSAYAISVFRDRKYGLRALGVFTGVYTLIYVLMRLEDFALLVGAFASFTAIGFTMYMTRNIDWYGRQETAE